MKCEKIRSTCGSDAIPLSIMAQFLSGLLRRPHIDDHLRRDHRRRPATQECEAALLRCAPALRSSAALLRCPPALPSCAALLRRAPVRAGRVFNDYGVIAERR